MNVSKKCSVGDLISAGRGLEELGTCGIRFIGPKEIFLAPQVIQQKLLWNTELKDVNIGDILARIPGAKRGRRRVAGYNCRGVIVPRSTFDLRDGDAL